MVRELVMAGICVVAVIALAWLMDHPNKVFGSVLALGAFVVLAVVAYLKKKDATPRRPRRVLDRNKKKD